MVFEVPDSLLLLLWISPNGDAVVFPLFSAPVRLHTGDFGDIPDTDASFDSCREEKVPVFGLAASLGNTSRAEQRSRVTAQRQIRLDLCLVSHRCLRVFAIKFGKVPQLDHAVLRDGCHRVDRRDELDASHDVHVRL